MARLLIEPPRLRSNDDPDEERHATWLELFFDLIFVVAISELAHTLTEHISDYLAHPEHDAAIWGFTLLFVPVWWLWVGVTFYNTRFDTDDLVQRLLVFAQIAIVAVMAVNIPHALDSTAANFAIAYVAGRVVLLLQYYRADRDIPAARPLTRWYIPGFTVAAAIWLASIFVPAPLRFYIWGLAMVVDIGTPISFGRRAGKLPANSSHIPERFALFTLIVIGEGVASVVRGMAAGGDTSVSIVAATLGLGIAFCLWWLYFDHVDGSAIQRLGQTGQVLRAQTWLYTHLPLAAALAAGSVGGELLAHSDPATALPDIVRWVIAGSLCVGYLSLGLIQRTTVTPQVQQHERSQFIYRVAAATLCLLLAAFGRGLTPLWVMATLAAISIAQVAIDLISEARAGIDPRPSVNQHETSALGRGVTHHAATRLPYYRVRSGTRCLHQPRL